MRDLIKERFFEYLSKKNETTVTTYFVLLSGISFTCGMALTKLVSASISSLMILFFRCFFAFIFFLPVAVRNGLSALKTERFFLHFFRIILMSTAMFCTYYAYRNLPLTIATAIGFSSPLFAAIFAHYFLKEEIRTKKWILIILGYVGVLIMLQPFSLTLSSDIFIAVLANILASGAIVLAKELSSTESTTTMMFYSTTASFIFSAIAVLGAWEFPPLKDLLLLIAIALFGLLSNLFYLTALKYGKASLVAPLEYMRLIFAMFIGYLLFHEVPNAKTILGALLIALSTFWLVRDESVVALK